MKCSICDNTRMNKMVYCSMCKSWHCTIHFNSALIHRPGRLVRGPLMLLGRVEVHGNIVEATYRGEQLKLSLVEVATDKYLVKLGNSAIGTIVAAREGTPSWGAYVGKVLVGQRQTIAGAVGCVIDGSIVC